VERKIPAPGKFWISKFSVERNKENNTVVFKVYPSQCGLDVPRLEVHEWQSGDIECTKNVTQNCTSQNKTCVSTRQKCEKANVTNLELPAPKSVIYKSESGNITVTEVQSSSPPVSGSFVLKYTDGEGKEYFTGGKFV